MEKNQVHYIERTVADADRRLKNISRRVEKWERTMSEVSLYEETASLEGSEEEPTVFDLLQDVTQVREDYEHLRSDISEIQQLQKEVSAGIRTKLNSMHEKYGFLRSKLGPALPSCLMMSTNSHQPSPAKNGGVGPRTKSQ